MGILKGKKIILGVTGSIAAYKACDICSILKKQGADITVIMTKNAMNFVNPITFETLTGNKCLMDTFDRDFDFKVEHIELAKAADILLVAPATANILAKAACGIADDMLSTTILSCTCKKLYAPAMNTRMLDNPATVANLKKLEEYGGVIISPASGYLACGDEGRGKLPDPAYLVRRLAMELYEKDMEGLSVLVTAGPTREKLDPVRFITNHSSGKMGYAIAAEAARRGAKVTLVSGRTALECPDMVERVDIESAADMAREVKSRAGSCDIIIKAAAVADYRPVSVADQKIKKKDGELSIPLERTEDILAYLGANKREGQIICGFSMETENLIENSRAKLEKKNADMIVANSLRDEGAGFGVDTNVVTIITREDMRSLPVMSKDSVAKELLDAALGLMRR